MPLYLSHTLSTSYRVLGAFEVTLEFEMDASFLLTVEVFLLTVPGKFGGKFGGNFCGIFSDPLDKGSTFRGTFLEHLS